jgi:uncharacterized protein (TIGR00725 family)
MRVTVFGSAMPKPEEADYQTAMTLGRILAKEGHTVLTGGYSGTMEAVSRGAAEAGGHVIGVTCAEIERWRSSITANSWVKEEWCRPTLQDRLMTLIDSCEAALTLPGGVGTLLEVCMMWNRLIIKAVPPRPLILIGPGWKTTLQSFLDEQGQYVLEADRHWLVFVDTIEEAAAKLHQKYIL